MLLMDFEPGESTSCRNGVAPATFVGFVLIHDIENFAPNPSCCAEEKLLGKDHKMKS